MADGAPLMENGWKAAQLNKQQKMIYLSSMGNESWLIGYQNTWGKVLEVQFDSFFEASCGIELTHETLSGMIAWQVEHK